MSQPPPFVLPPDGPGSRVRALLADAGRQRVAVALLALAALLVAVAGIALAAALYLSPSGEARRARIYERARAPIDAARNGFFVDDLYGRAFVLPGKAFSGFAAHTVDAGVIDGIVNGTGRLVAGASEGLRRWQTGYVRNYGATFLLGVVVIFSILFVRGVVM